MPKDARSCPSCGASVSPDAEACDLCGTPIEPSPADTPDERTDGLDAQADSPSEAGSSPSEEASSKEPPTESVYCHHCGAEHTIDANYCSQCGTELQDVTGASPSTPEGTRPVTADLPTGDDRSASSSEESVPSEETTASATDEEQGEMGRQIMLVVGAAVVLVLGLFFLTQWSQQYEWGGEEGSPVTEQQSPESNPGASSTPSGPTTGTGGTPSPQAATAEGPTDLSTLVDELGGSVEGPVANKIDSLQAAVEAAGDNRQPQLKAQLAKLYVGAGAPGRAALTQSRLADQSGRVEDRLRAANLLYKWMRQVERQKGRAEVVDVARHVAEAYAAVVEERPKNLDARTRMGEAYLLTNNPMKGIRAINQVLDDDSTFVPARFQKGLALLQINRLDQAVAQFEAVMTYASQDDPFYRQAKRAIEVIRKRAGAAGQDAS